MKMHRLSARDRFYNESNFNIVQMVYRRPVVPGQSFSLSGEIKIQSEPFLTNRLTGGMTDVTFSTSPTV